MSFETAQNSRNVFHPSARSVSAGIEGDGSQPMSNSETETMELPFAAERRR